MNQAFKKSLAIVLTLMLVLLTACGGTAAPSGGTATPSGSTAPAPGGDNASTGAPVGNAVVIACGGIQPVDDPITLAMEYYSDIVAERSGGTIDIQVYPASQLGNATSMLEAVSMGSQDMLIDSTSFMSQYIPDKIIETMFFMFRDDAHYRAHLASDVSNGWDQQFLEMQNTRCLAKNWVRIPRSIVSKKPITTIGDMKGVKMRVPDVLGYLESVSAMGANPTQVAWGETYLALQQGVVDGAEAPLDQVWTTKFYEAAPYVTLTEHQRDNVGVFINEDKFQSLSPEQQTILTECANEAGDWYVDKINAGLEESVDNLTKAGVTFIEPEIDGFRKAVEDRIMKLEAEGKWSKGLYEKIQALS